MNSMTAHLSSIKSRIVMVVMLAGILLNSCQKDKLAVPLNVGTIRFAANSYTIENNTIDPLKVVIPLSLPLEEDATAIISIDNQSTIAASEFTVDPAIPAAGLTIKLPKGATEISFNVSSLNNFEGEKTLILKLSSPTGGLTVANVNATTTINVKGNPIILPEIKTSESGLAFGSVITSTNSASKSYTVTGVKLTANVVITASANFQVSLDDITYTSSVTIPVATANTAPVPVYARFNATTGANQTVSGTITHTSTGVPDVSVSVSGIEYGVASAGVLLKKEDFSYTTAGSLSTASGNAWVPITTGAGANPVLFTTTGLTYTGYTGSGVGGALTMENRSASAEDITLNFPSQTSGVIYTAQLVNFTAGPPTAADFFLSLGDGTAPATPAYYDRVYAKADGSKISIGLGRNSNVVVYAPTSLDLNTTYLLVHKYEFATGNSSLYVLSGAIPVIEPATPGAISNTAGADPAAMTRYVVRQGTGAPLKVTVDGIRIATSWKDAVGL